MNSQSDFDQKLRLDYLQEAKELLADVESCFLKLENDTSNRELIDRIFRMIHTVKGSGSIAGFDSFTRFAHQFESLLTLIRAGQLLIDKAVMDLIFEANDRLKEWVSELELNHAFELDISSTASKLASYTSAQGHAAKPAINAGPAFGFFEDTVDTLLPHTVQATILLVDDEVDILDLYENYLQNTAVQTLRALNGVEAVPILNSKVPDVIILDLKMPGMNGLEFLAYVRKKMPDVPVIFVSGYSERNDIIHMLNLGAFAFMNKPVNREVFLAELWHGLRERSLRRQIMKLTQLNFMASLTLAKITHTRVALERQSAGIKMQKILDEIVDLQNSILEAKYPYLIS